MVSGGVFVFGFFLIFSWFVFGQCSHYAGGENSNVNIAGVCLVVVNLSQLEEYTVLHLR